MFGGAPSGGKDYLPTLMGDTYFYPKAPLRGLRFVVTPRTVPPLLPRLLQEGWALLERKFEWKPTDVGYAR